jgi:pimeloyl-ACP methyl ester carboxylesterase
VATFVLVHGGGHGGWCYKFVSERLRAKGHLVHAPSLTGLGERSHLMSPAINLDTHITDITSMLEYEDLCDVILVGHSYGGMVITGVADRASDRIGHLVYLDAANPVNGQSLVDVAGPMMEMARNMGEVRDGIELVLLPEKTQPQFFGVTDLEQVAWMQAKLSPHPWACFAQPLTLSNEAALWAIPQSHLICASTIEGRGMIGGDQYHGAIHQIDTGHDLMVTEPDWVAQQLCEIAAVMDEGKAA